MGLLDQFGKGASGGTISKPGLSKAGKRGGIIRKSIAGAVGIVVVIVCVLAVEAITGLHPGSQSSPSDIGENQQNCTSLDLSFAAELFKELPPSNSGVNSEHDKKICLDVVGRYYGSRTTGERDAFCSDYGAFTPKKSDAAKQFFIDTIDKSTPENRYNWCVEDGVFAVKN